MEETQKLETDIRIAGLTETFHIARQALETRLLSELEEKDETFFTGSGATQDLCALGEKQEFCVEVVPNGIRELVDFKTDSAKDVLVKVEKLELVESFENCRKFKELTTELLGERGVKSA